MLLGSVNHYARGPFAVPSYIYICVHIVLSYTMKPALVHALLRLPTKLTNPPLNLVCIATLNFVRDLDPVSVSVYFLEGFHCGS